MKYTGHLPVESYGFIEFEVEGEPSDAIEAYRALKAEFARKQGAGIPLREFTAFVDEYMMGGGKLAIHHAETIERMDERQQYFVSEMRKCFGRVSRKVKLMEKVQEPDKNNYVNERY